MARRAATLSERFWSKVDTSGNCWEWTAQRTPNGYGQIRMKREGRWSYDRAHRVSYLLNIGQIPQGLCVLHRCDNRGCVKPEHLWLGTYQDNLRDMHAKGRSVNQTKPELLARGERNGWATLTEDAARAIKTRYPIGGITMAVLGAQYGVTKSAVYAVLHGKTWRHI